MRGGPRGERRSVGQRRRRTSILAPRWGEVVRHVGELLCQELLEAGIGELRTRGGVGLWGWRQRQTIDLQVVGRRRWEVGLLRVLLGRRRGWEGGGVAHKVRRLLRGWRRRR